MVFVMKLAERLYMITFVHINLRYTEYTKSMMCIEIIRREMYIFVSK